MKAEGFPLTLDGRPVLAEAGQTLFELAAQEGIAIPRLCHRPGLPGLPVAGNCRVCVVEVQGERALAASCCRLAQPGMVVHTGGERARAARRLVVELLQADLQDDLQNGAVPPEPAEHEVHAWAERLGVAPAQARFPLRPRVAADDSHPAIAVDMNACIQCTRCVRACREVQVNGVIGLAGRGTQARIVFDLGDDLGASSCVACGECVQACPTGALRSRPLAPALPPVAEATRRVDTLCPYCGVGCQLSLQVQGAGPAAVIVQVEGRDGPANAGRLCVKGRYGQDYTRHAQRLTVPLVRRSDAPKRAAMAAASAAEQRAQFREASWQEALALAGAGLRRIRDTLGSQALAGFGSAKGSNEEAYLFQKLVRLGFGSHNVDHCTRLCHASSVAALLEGIGSGAVSNPVRDVALAEVVLVVGANPGVNHPVAASWIKNAVQAGTQLVLLDPRAGDLAPLATHHLAFKPGTDVALLNALMQVIVEEDLVDHAFIAARTEGFEAFAQNLRACTPERMAPVCGVPAETLRAVARLYAKSRSAMIFWGMGVSQHVHGTDNARCLIALALMTGQIGRPGTGLHPLRGQNNVQGASDAGLIPMMYPDYQRVDDPAVRERFATAWGVAPERLSTRPGLTVVEVLRAAEAGQVKGLLVMGENPAMSDPDLNHARAALAALDTLVVQDIFLTETAALADVVLPAGAFAEKTGSFTNTDRSVQLGRAALPPPGQARQDLAILIDLAQQLGLDWGHYGDANDPARSDAAVAAVFDEMRRLMPSISGIGWARLQAEGAVTYPCHAEGDAGEPVVFTTHFPTASGRARFVPVGLVPAAEQPDADFPLVLITGRQLEHWHTGSMTRRSQVLDALEPEPVALMNPQDLAAWGVVPGTPVTLHTRRGQVCLYARADPGTPPGAVFVAFCWAEAAVNRLTNPALDPVAKIPEFKFCAVRVQPGGQVAVHPFMAPAADPA